nr:alpha/beta hydrolase [Legionella waltersii]
MAQPQAFQLDKKASSPKQSKEIVILVHGLLRTSLSMMPLKSFLESQGYEVLYYKYPSTKYSIHEHGDHLSQYVQTIMHDNPGVTIHFVTHSLGGIIVREALPNLSKSQMGHIGYLVMLAPPNQGSMGAKFAVKLFPFVNYFIKPLAELSSDQAAYVHKVPVPQIPMGIIAGRYDSKVPPEYTRLAGQQSPVIIDATHTFIMNKYRTKKLIVYFLKHGKFPV